MTTQDILALYSTEMERHLAQEHKMDAMRNLATFILALMIIATYMLPMISSHLILYLGSPVIFALQYFDARAQSIARATELRISLMEKNAIAGILSTQQVAAEGWSERLARSYQSGGGRIGFVESFAIRLRETYFAVFLALDMSWLAKLYLFPREPESFWEFVHRMDCGPLPGWFTAGFIVIFWGSYTGLLIWLRGKERGLDRPQ
jgi:uncharacterized membrane protein